MELLDGETININKADVDDLVRLPGIGQVMAERICETRQALGGFRSLDELKKVKGIGEKLYQKIKEYVVLE